MRARISFVPLLPSVNAATRTFCDEPADALQPRWNTHVYEGSSSGAYRRLRLARRFRVVRSAIYWYGRVLPTRLIQFSRIASSDVVVVQRGMLRYRSWPFLEAAIAGVRAIRGRPRLILHIDDALYVHNRRAFAARARLMDMVITGNVAVAEEARASGASVRMIEAGIAVERYRVDREPRVGPVVLGWVGTNAAENLRPIEQALASVCDGVRARLVVISDIPYLPQVPSLDFEFRPWSLERHVASFAQLDVGLMPLSDTDYNRGKESYKLKEYMAAGLPTVASPVGHNTSVALEGVTGLFASTVDEWAVALGRLVGDPALRVRMGREGQARAAALYSSTRLHKEIEAAIAEVLLLAGAKPSPSTRYNG